MDIKIHSFGTPESLDLRCILENMYRKAGVLEKVRFPDDNTVQLTLDGEYVYEYEYGIHKMVRISPRDTEFRRRSSYVMVEINGKARDYPIVSYIFHPRMVVKNHLLMKESSDLFGVLNGNPLGLEKKCEDSVFMSRLATANLQAA
jgi:protein subunit release factor B